MLLFINKSIYIYIEIGLGSGETLEHLQPHSIFHFKIEFRVKNVPMVLYFSLYNRVKNMFTPNIE